MTIVFFVLSLLIVWAASDTTSISLRYISYTVWPVLILTSMMLLGRIFGSLGNNENTNDLTKCPACAEMIKREAIKCKHCGSAVG